MPLRVPSRLTCQSSIAACSLEMTAKRRNQNDSELLLRMRDEVRLASRRSRRKRAVPSVHLTQPPLSHQLRNKGATDAIHTTQFEHAGAVCSSYIEVTIQ